MPRLFLLLCLCFITASRGHAQAADSVRHVSAAALRQAVAGTPGEQPRATYGGMVVDAGSYTVIQLRRTSDGEAEVHEEWEDVMVVQEGAATLLSGGEVRGGRQTAPGEMRGGQISGGARRLLAPGDLVTVPAGIPHQMLLGPGQSITYLVLKVRRGSPSAP
jgi:mannose-6-phosphate isomerase-like protein (cupin superfamily)